MAVEIYHANAEMVGLLLWVQQYTFTKLIGLTENMIIRPWFEPSHPSPSPEPEDRITIKWAVLRYSHSPVLDIQGHGSFKRRMERGNHRDKMSFSGFINYCKSSVNLYFFKAGNYDTKILDPSMVMQLFSPLFMSQWFLIEQRKNPCTSITCENGFIFVFKQVSLLCCVNYLNLF